MPHHHTKPNTKRKNLSKFLPEAAAPKGKQRRVRDSKSPVIAVISAHRVTLVMQVQVNGTRKLYTLGRYDGTEKSITDARKRAHDKAEEFDAMRSGKVVPGAVVIPTLKQQLEHYIAMRNLERGARLGPMKTEDQLRTEFENHFAAMLPLSCAAITPEWMQTRVLKDPPPKRALSNLNSVLKRLYETDRIPDPFELTGHKVHSTNTRPGEEEPLIKALAQTPHRLAEALEAVRNYSNPAVKAFGELLLFTGRRPEELVNLRWDHVDLERKVYDIADHKASKGQGLFLPMSDHVHTVLTEWQARHALRHPGHPYLFPHRTKARNEPMSESGYRGFADKVRELTGFEEFYPYQFRKAFGTLGCTGTVSDTDRKHLMGHKQEGVTAHYSFAGAELLREPLARVTAKLLEYATPKAKAA